MYQRKKSWQNALASSIEAKRSGKPGRYFRVLNWASEVVPTDDAHAVAAEQIRALLGRLPADGPVPLCVFDAGYDPMKLARELGDLDGERVAVLVRLRSGRCFYADPEQQPHTGRPRRHGRKLACDDPTTWRAPTGEHREEHAQYGAVRVRV